jgi:sugar phosphate isomerase/epimerase
MLAPYLDEIELVLFESGEEDNLPSVDDVKQLVSIAADTGLSYNVHLPLDIFLGDSDPGVREHGVRCVQKIIGLTTPLEPSTYIIHFELRKPDGRNYEDLEGWKEQLGHSIEAILNTGVASSRIAVETLHYPFEHVEDIVEGLGLSVCLDLGHLIAQSYSVSGYAERYFEKTPVVHLHGARNGKDHRSLDVLDKKVLKRSCAVLRGFSGVVSIEVFSFHDLSASLMLMETQFRGG